MSEPGNTDDYDDDALTVARAYRHAPSAEPSSGLDDAIRAAARREVGARPLPRGRSLLHRWATPVSIAAVVVLTVSIGLLSVDEKPEMVPQPMRELSRPSPESVKEIPRDANDRPKTVMPAERTESTPAATAAGELVDKPKQPAVRDETLPLLENKRNAAPVAPAAGPVAPKRQRDYDIKTQAPPSADAIDQNQVAGRRAPATEPPSAPAHTEQGLEKFETQRKPDARGVAPESTESRALLRPKAAAVPTDHVEAAEDWMKRIVDLHRDGKTEEARAELEKFQRRYPDYPLPAELRAYPYAVRP
jgi:hypothetical protein